MNSLSRRVETTPDRVLICGPEAHPLAFPDFHGCRVLGSDPSAWGEFVETAVVTLVGHDDWAQTVVDELRLRGIGAPVLVLRQSGGSSGAVALLNAGADSCLPSESTPEERDAVIAALLRRGPLRSDGGHQVVLNESGRSLSLRGEQFKFGPVAFAVVRHLVLNRGRWVSQREIVEQAIGTHYRADSAVARVQVHQIRKTLGHYRSCIQQEGNRGCGYMFSLADFRASAASGMYPAVRCSELE